MPDAEQKKYIGVIQNTVELQGTAEEVPKMSKEVLNKAADTILEKSAPESDAKTGLTDEIKAVKLSDNAVNVTWNDKAAQQEAEKPRKAKKV